MALKYRGPPLELFRKDSPWVPRAYVLAQIRTADGADRGHLTIRVLMSLTDSITGVRPLDRLA